MRKGVETGGGSAEDELGGLVLVRPGDRLVGDTEGGSLVIGGDEIGVDRSVSADESNPTPLLELEDAEVRVGDTACPSLVVLGRLDPKLDVLEPVVLLYILPNTTDDVM